MGYKYPFKKGIKYAISEGWDKEDAERGFDIFDYDGTGMLEIEIIGDAYFYYDDEDDEVYEGFVPSEDLIPTDDDAAIEAERIGFCKIIPVEELPENFDRRYFGWVDTPENRKAIEDYCKKYCK